MTQSLKHNDQTSSNLPVSWCFSAFAQACILISLSILLFVLSINVNWTHPAEVVELGEKLASPEKLYRNTLHVNYIQSSFVNLNETCPLGSLAEKIIKSERLYQSKMKLRNDWILRRSQNDATYIHPWNKKTRTHIWHYFPAAFNCPHSLERIGRLGQGGKWVCGLEVYESVPRPQECVIYIFGGHDQSLEKELVRRTDCHIFSFNSHSKVKLSFSHQRVRIVHNVIIGDYNEEDTKGTWGTVETLLALMKENGHAWVDILVMNIGGRELSVLEQVMEDFDEVLPFGQLQIEIHIPTEKDQGTLTKKFYKWFNGLESKGLRPFHNEANLLDGCNVQKDETKYSKFQTVMEYAFINIRGKHLLLTGK